MNFKKEFTLITTPPDMSRQVIVKYKNGEKSRYGTHLDMVHTLYYDVRDKKFRTKKGKNKTHKITHWKDVPIS